jgi:putative transposase
MQRSVNNHLKQDHRGIKQRYRSMGGFKADTTAVYVCGLFDEIRSFLQSQSGRNQPLSLARRRDIQQARFIQLMELMAAA